MQVAYVGPAIATGGTRRKSTRVPIRIIYAANHDNFAVHSSTPAQARSQVWPTGCGLFVPSRMVESITALLDGLRMKTVEHLFRLSRIRAKIGRIQHNNKKAVRVHAQWHGVPDLKICEGCPTGVQSGRSASEYSPLYSRAGPPFSKQSPPSWEVKP